MEKSYKITTKQAYTLFMLAAFSPLVRLVSTAGGRAGWLSVIISCAVFCGFIALLSLYFKKRENTDLFSLFRSAFGRFIAGVLVLLYAIWVFGLAGYYLRAFSEKFTGWIMPGVPGGFFIITLLALVFIILSGRFHSFALLSDVFFYIALLALAVIFMLQIPRIHPENLLPVTHYDAGGIVRGVLPSLGIFAYITPVLFLAGEINHKQCFRRYGLYSALTLLAAGLVIFVTTVGVFGKDLVAEMEQPFLMSVKTVGVGGALERLESVFLLLWVVTDLAIIVMFLHVLLKLISVLTGECMGEPCKVYKSPILLGVYVLSLFMTQVFDMLKIPGLRLNLIMGFGVPVAAVVLCGVKRKIRKSQQSIANV
jgi:spore germination protein (amino acid permease)